MLKNKERVLRWKQLRALLNVSRTSVWRWENTGNFPSRRRLGPGATGATGWLETEVLAWLESRQKLDFSMDKGETNG